MSSMQESKKPFKLFYCYADKDKVLLDKLEDHLSALRREGEIESYNRRDISAGTDWKDELTRYMNKSSIILLLISPSFLASEYNYSHEMRLAIQRRKANKAIIIPIIIRECDWGKIPFGDHETLSNYQVLPQNKKAVKSWYNQDKAFTEIVQSIRQAVHNLREYAEELKTDPTHIKPKSIYPNQLHSQGHKAIEADLENSQANVKTKSIRARNAAQYSPTPKTANKTQNTRKSAPKVNAQLAETNLAPTSWDRKSLPKPQRFFKLKNKYFSFEKLNKYRNGRVGVMFLSFLAFDVGGIAIISKDWSISQQLPGLIFAISLLIFMWGIFNRHDLIAILLTMFFGTAWFIIGLNYLPWHPITIPIVILAVSSILSIIRFFLFRKN